MGSGQAGRGKGGAPGSGRRTSRGGVRRPGGHSRCRPRSASKVPEAPSPPRPWRPVSARGAGGVTTDIWLHLADVCEFLQTLDWRTETISGTGSWSPHGSIRQHRATNARKARTKGCFGGHCQSTGPLMGYSPQARRRPRMRLVVQDRQKPPLSLLSVLRWLGSTSCCHGNPASSTVRWTQSRRPQGGPGGPREFDSLLAELPWRQLPDPPLGRKHLQLLIPFRSPSWGWPWRRRKSLPKADTPPNAHPATFAKAKDFLHNRPHGERGTGSVCPQGGDATPGPSLRTRAPG